jgi:hypothetical protein
VTKSPCCTRVAIIARVSHFAVAAGRTIEAAKPLCFKQVRGRLATQLTRCLCKADQPWQGHLKWHCRPVAGPRCYHNSGLTFTAMWDSQCAFVASALAAALHACSSNNIRSKHLAVTAPTVLVCLTVTFVHSDIQVMSLSLSGHLT